MTEQIRWLSIQLEQRWSLCIGHWRRAGSSREMIWFVTTWSIKDSAHRFLEAKRHWYLLWHTLSVFLRCRNHLVLWIVSLFHLLAHREYYWDMGPCRAWAKSRRYNHDTLSIFWRRGDGGICNRRCLAAAHLEARGIFLLPFSTSFARAFFSFGVGRVPDFLYIHFIIRLFSG